MYTYLIVDDEQIERKGIRMLLGRMNIREGILEAANGEEALEIIRHQSVDILLTDVNMPFMDGIELLSHVHREYPDTVAVIFSGYDDFSYAKQAISYGVSAYILKPVNPEEFNRVIREITEKLDRSHLEEKRKDESMGFLREHILYLMVNGQSKSSILDKHKGLLDLGFVDEYCRMVLLECADPYFEQVDKSVLEDMKSALQIQFQYLNLNPWQSLLLFFGEQEDGWEELGRKIYSYLKDSCRAECFLALSDDMCKERKELSEYYAQTEKLMEQRFYETGSHVFLPFHGEHSEVFVQVDAEILIRQIQQDIKMKDTESLQEHFEQFCGRYEHQRVFSQIYIKFMFSNLLKEIYDHLQDMDEMELDREIDSLYRSNDMESVIRTVRAGIDRLEKVFASAGVSKRREVEQIKQYIQENYSDSSLGVE